MLRKTLDCGTKNGSVRNLGTGTLETGLGCTDVQSGGIVVPLPLNPVPSAPPIGQPRHVTSVGTSHPAELTAAAASHCSASMYLSVGSRP